MTVLPFRLVERVMERDPTLTIEELEQYAQVLACRFVYEYQRNHQDGHIEWLVSPEPA